MPEVIVRRRARADVREAALRYERERPGLGVEFTTELDVVVARISQNPLQFPEVGGGTRRALLRRFPYALYFFWRGRVAIIAVLHQRRDPDRWKERR
jgi:plasmid stabilization system protein ParE